jgi:hypothetical protein
MPYIIFCLIKTQTESVKKITLFLFVLCLFSNLSAQTVNDIPLKDIDVEYIQVIGTSKLLSTKAVVQIDFGQSTKLFNRATDTRIRDENGNFVEFNSVIDALNFMSANGYDFVDAYSTVINQQNTIYHYLLRKQKK